MSVPVDAGGGVPPGRLRMRRAYCLVSPEPSFLSSSPTAVCPGYLPPAVLESQWWFSLTMTLFSTLDFCPLFKKYSIKDLLCCQQSVSCVDGS